MCSHILRSFIMAVSLLFLSVSWGNAQVPVDYSDFSKWQTLKGDHFVVYYYDRGHASTASHVLTKAEEYYDKVAYQIGYARYGDFWTWEDRVKIFIFPDQLSFLLTTGQKVWSKGYAVRDSKLFESRAIVTYHQEESFINNLLPHEIAHLVVKDFIGFERPLPLWFEEGVAQQQEMKDPSQEDGIVFLAKSGQHIPFELLNMLDIRRETQELKVAVFYAQSRSVVEFLIKVYGREAFERLCVNLRDGMDLLQAFANAYGGSIDSMAALERKWLDYMRGK